jgi:hypothetical protein
VVFVSKRIEDVDVEDCRQASAGCGERCLEPG